jgi:hypothetical protein
VGNSLLYSLLAGNSLSNPGKERQQFEQDRLARNRLGGQAGQGLSSRAYGREGTTDRKVPLFDIVNDRNRPTAPLFCSVCRLHRLSANGSVVGLSAPAK